MNLGAGRTARAINSGSLWECALLDNGTLRCWGVNTFGNLGYGNVATIGDNETPDTVGPVQLGESMTSARGDAALTLTADATSRQVGQNVVLTATLSSGGPDAVQGAGTTIALPPGLQIVGATTSAGSFAGGVWSVPALAPGSSATLTAVARVAAPGTQTASAEVTGLAPFFLDLDSAPNNHLAGEDDQASVTITGTATATATNAANARPVLSALSMLRRTFAVAPGPTAALARRLTPRGSSFRFTLSKGSTVAILIGRAPTGRTATAPIGAARATRALVC